MVPNQHTTCNMFIYDGINSMCTQLQAAHNWVYYTCAPQLKHFCSGNPQNIYNIQQPTTQALRLADHQMQHGVTGHPHAVLVQCLWDIHTSLPHAHTSVPKGVQYIPSEIGSFNITYPNNSSHFKMQNRSFEDQLLPGCVSRVGYS